MATYLVLIICKIFLKSCKIDFLNVTKKYLVAFEDDQWDEIGFLRKYSSLWWDLIFWRHGFWKWICKLISLYFIHLCSFLSLYSYTFDFKIFFMGCEQVVEKIIIEQYFDYDIPLHTWRRIYKKIFWKEGISQET